MEINSNFNVNLNSITEFARVMVPESLKEKIFIEGIETSSEITIKIKIKDKEKSFSYKNLGDKVDDQKSTMIKVLLTIFYEKNYSWGCLMGVRPTKIVRRLLDLKCDIPEIREILKNFYLIKDEKINLMIDVALKEEQFLNRKMINIYIGIPFCPTKCTYCSFASYEITGGVGKYYKKFIETLLEEIKIVGRFLSENKYKIESIYIGGGTPSVLENNDIKYMLKTICENIDMSNVKEFTFEGGREDTLTKEKLQIIKEHQVNRISINPQTFNEATLDRINRKLNKEHFDEMYNISKELGFIINMDLIIGLPGENTEDIIYTLETMKGYQIDNLTIHSLAFKRASNLFKEDRNRNNIDKDRVMGEIIKLMSYKNMRPYYLYRQKNIIEWGENVGYSLDGKESIFNIEMIEENQCTIGLGGGAITKIISKDENNRDYIKRIINPKDPTLYMREMENRTIEKFEYLKSHKI
ncbi:MAG: coproporphyrinogen III oxidase [Fusobacteriaceae bacterium]|jgi:oxygen-independent coproporphyrinogen-3 oxidase|nr:coproporphyrinogen III oxidase [Fusobacteriaceae bacterium]